MWTVENLEDVKSDMSAFHRVDDVATMPGSSFFPRVERLAAYKGIVQMRLRVAAVAEEQRFPATRGATASPSQRQEVPESVMLAEHERDGWGERG